MVQAGQFHGLPSEDANAMENHSRGMGKTVGLHPSMPHHGIEYWLVLQNFYDGLIALSRGHIDAATRGAFPSN
jgi:hypothetical protein